MALTVDDFDFPLPPELIAQHPAPERTGSRLLHVCSRQQFDRKFADLTLGLIWRWLSRNGLPYEQEALDYTHALEQYTSREGTRTILSATEHADDPRSSRAKGLPASAGADGWVGPLLYRGHVRLRHPVQRRL